MRFVVAANVKGRVGVEARGHGCERMKGSKAQSAQRKKQTLTTNGGKQERRTRAD